MSYMNDHLHDARQRFLNDGFGDNLWIDLINSEHLDGFGKVTDHLEEPDWVATLLDHFRLGSEWAGSPPESILELRSWLREVAEVFNANQRLGADQIDHLNRLLAYPVGRELDFSESGEPVIRFRTAEPDWHWLGAEAAYSLAQHLTPKHQKRIKICSNPNCRWVFYDKTKGNNRKWCNDLTCGNRDRVRRFRSK